MTKTDNSAKQWGARLKQARLAAGLSQKQLGIQAGIDEFVASTRINRYELGVHMPDYLTAQNLAKVLGVSVAFFYAPEDHLAELILSYSKTQTERRSASKSLQARPSKKT